MPTFAPLTGQLLSDGVCDPATERMADEMIGAVGLQGTDFSGVVDGHLLDGRVSGHASIESDRHESVNSPVPRQLTGEVEKVIHVAPQTMDAEDRGARSRRLHGDERIPRRARACVVR